MTFNPWVFIIIGGVSATVAITTAIFTLLAERRRVAQERDNLEEQAKRITQPQKSSAITVSRSAIRTHEFDARALRT